MTAHRETNDAAGGALVQAGELQESPSPTPRRRRPSFLQAGRSTPLPRQFALRLILLRFLVNAVALALVVVVVPDIYFQGNYRIVSWLAISAVFGLLNAFIKPIVQVLMLPLWVYSYGVVIILINAVMLWILDVIVPARFEVGSLIPAFLGGLVFGVIASILENLLGLTPPIFEGEPEDLKKEIERRNRNGMETRIVTAGASLAHRHPGTSPAGPSETIDAGDSGAATEAGAPEDASGEAAVRSAEDEPTVALRPSEGEDEAGADLSGGPPPDTGAGAFGADSAKAGDR